MKDINWIEIAIAICIVIGVGSCMWENAKLTEYCISKGMIRSGEMGCQPVRGLP
jgi:hypothetical protein